VCVSGYVYLSDWKTDHFHCGKVKANKISVISKMWDMLDFCSAGHV